MSNSKNNNETNSKSSFNKSKSISSAMDDLEMGRPISKATSDLELEDSTSELEKSDSTNDLKDKSSSNVDLEIVSEDNESKSDKESNYDDLSSFLDEDDEDELLESEDLNGETLVESEDLESVHKLEDNFDVQDNSEKDLVINDLNDDTDIFVSPSKVSDKINLDVIKKQEELNMDFDEDVSLARPAKKSKDSTEFNSSSFKSISRPAKKSKDSKSKKFSKKFNFSIKNFKLFSGIELSTKSKIFAIVALLLGIVTIIYGILNFNNVSDKVIDHVLLGEAGSWSIFLIIIGLIIIIFDVFYISYSNKSVTKSNIKNSQIRNTFDVIDKIKSIDEDYYNGESDLDSLFDDILFDKESSDNNLKNSDFKEDEIYMNHSVKDLDEIYSAEKAENVDLDFEDVSDSYDLDSLNDENSIFDKGTEDLSDLVVDDLNVIRETEDVKSDKKSNYDDLSSFLEEDEEDTVETSNKEDFKKAVDIDSLINDSKSKSIQDEDLAAKKARIIEGTNFDNSLRKSK